MLLLLLWNEGLLFVSSNGVSPVVEEVSPNTQTIQESKESSSHTHTLTVTF